MLCSEMLKVSVEFRTSLIISTCLLALSLSGRVTLLDLFALDYANCWAIWNAS